MPVAKLKDTPTPVINSTIRDFKDGTISLLDPSRMSPMAASLSLNQYQTQDGLWTTKWGSGAYTQPLPGGYMMDGSDEFVDTANVTHIVAVGGGNVYTCTDNGAWTLLTGATLTPGKTCYFIQIHGFLYIANGVDPLTRYDGTNLLQYTALGTPSAPTLTASTDLTSGTPSQKYYYQIVALNNVGNSIPSSEATVMVNKLTDQWNPNRTTTSSLQDTITLTWTAVTGAVSYSIYRSTQTGYETYLDSTNALTYVDDGSLFTNDNVETPNDNTSVGPYFQQMELSDNRIWGTGDLNNPWRVYWTGTGQNLGTFSPFYGGGYVDLEKGGKDRPKNVSHYRDGKGNAFATVFSGDPQGNGATWQVDLTVTTIGSTSFITPSVTKVVGSTGAVAPLGVVKVANDIHYANTKGAYNVGSRPNLLNVLSTDEISANVRPDWRNMSANAMGKIAAFFYLAKVFWAVPYANDSNNEIWIFDTEHNNWQLRWTGVAVAKFFEYTDSSGVSHLLCVPVKGGQLLELSPEYTSDSGTPFIQDFATGVLPVDPKDHIQFGQVTYCYIELGHLNGQVTFSLYGTDKEHGFIFINSLDISSGGTSSAAGWGTLQWSSAFWSDTSIAPIVSSVAIVKKRLRINKLLNNYQLRVTSKVAGTSYTILQLQIKGFMIPTSDPPSWIRGTTTAVTGTTPLPNPSGTDVTTESGDYIVLE